VERYKSWQLVVVGWNAKRKGLGFFGHVAWQASGLSETVERKELKQSVSRRRPANALAIRAANINLAKSQALAGAQHGGCDDAVLVAQGFEEAGVHLHGGAGAEFAEVLHEGEHHGGVCRCHHRLAAEHAADAGELIAVRQAQRDLAANACLHSHLKGLHPRGEVFGEGGLKFVDIHACRIANSNPGRLFHGAHAVNRFERDGFQICALQHSELDLGLGCGAIPDFFVEGF
jgi:hypothetical protein